jgi:hypothetical protein
MVGSYISRLIRSRVPAARHSDNSFGPPSPCAFPWLRPRRALHEHLLALAGCRDRRLRRSPSARKVPWRAARRDSRDQDCGQRHYDEQEQFHVIPPGVRRARTRCGLHAQPGCVTHGPPPLNRRREGPDLGALMACQPEGEPGRLITDRGRPEPADLHVSRTGSRPAPSRSYSASICAQSVFCSAPQPAPHDHLPVR